MTSNCPVCRVEINPRDELVINRHRDQIGRNCPASGQPICNKENT